MAPEIAFPDPDEPDDTVKVIAPYDGAKVDIFALGVTLFIMIARDQPIKVRADAKDDSYKYLADNDPKGFWNYFNDWHSSNKSFFTEDLKSLVNGMLSFKPEERFTIAKIREQPWTRGETATYEEVVDYMCNM